MNKLGFIGGGNMAEALVRGLLNQGLLKPADLIVSDVDPARRKRLSRALRVETTADNLAVVRNARAIVLAIKPQTIDPVLAEIARMHESAPGPRRRAGARAATLRSRLFISIAAGVPLARIEKGLGRDARVIRVMPNAPAMVGEGMAALVRGTHATRADEAFALRLFRAVGDAVALNDEALLDGVTALSGSGPAYVYLFVQALTEAGAREGLPAELAMRLALATLRGAEKTLRLSRLELAELMRIVASPGGSTEAALRRFAEAGFSDIVTAAVSVAAKRSRELGRSGTAQSASNRT